MKLVLLIEGPTRWWLVCVDKVKREDVWSVEGLIDNGVVVCGAEGFGTVQDDGSVMVGCMDMRRAGDIA